jgi:hypothetical protein
VDPALPYAALRFIDLAMVMQVLTTSVTTGFDHISDDRV